MRRDTEPSRVNRHDDEPGRPFAAPRQAGTAAVQGLTLTVIEIKGHRRIRSFMRRAEGPDVDRTRSYRPVTRGETNLSRKASLKKRLSRRLNRASRACIHDRATVRRCRCRPRY